MASPASSSNRCLRNALCFFRHLIQSISVGGRVESHCLLVLIQSISVGFINRCLRNALCFFRHEASSRVESAVWSPRGRENESSSSNLHLIGVYGISRREGRISVGGRVEVFTECVVFFPACFFRHEASSRVPDTPRQRGERMVFIAFIEANFNWVF